MKEKGIKITAGFLGAGAFLLAWRLRKYRLRSLKQYTRDCLYMAVLEDEICRNELEGNKISGREILFPPRRETLQAKYHYFLGVNRKMTGRELEKEIRRMEQRREASLAYLKQPKQTLKLQKR